MHGFQAVSIELGLLLPYSGVNSGSLCFYYSEGLAIITPEDVISVTHALFIGHPRHFILNIPLLIQWPASTP